MNGAEYATSSPDAYAETVQRYVAPGSKPCAVSFDVDPGAGCEIEERTVANVLDEHSRP